MRLGLLVLANTLIERRWCNRAYLPAVQADMRECMARSKSMGDAEKREAFPAKVAAWNSSLEALQKASTDAAVFLAKYDVRQAESRVGMVRELLEEARAQVSQTAAGPAAPLVCCCVVASRTYTSWLPPTVGSTQEVCVSTTW